MKNKIKNNPRIILNKIRWDSIYDIRKLRISYSHRGANENIKFINGGDIISIDKSFFETKNSNIPYHRIMIIKYDKKILFDRLKDKK